MPEASRYYRSRFIFDPARDAVWKEICRFLQSRHIAKDSTILEIGAGYCHFINNIQGREKHALDIAEEMRRYAGGDVVTHIQSCTSMEGIADAYFDVVFASNLLEHLTREEMEQTLLQIKRTLKKGGMFMTLQPNFKYCYRSYFDDYTHVQIFTHTGLSDLLVAAGFRLASVTPRFLPFSMKSNLPKAPWLVRCYLQSPFKPFAAQMLVVATT